MAGAATDQDRRAVAGIVTPNADNLRTLAGVYPFGEDGDAPSHTPPSRAPHPIDLSVDNQLDGVYGVTPGLFLPQAYPYLEEDDDVHQLAVFQAGVDFTGHSMLDWEPEVMDTYSTGTIGIASGVVTGSGTTFPDDAEYDTNPVYKRRLYVGDAWYEVATRDSGTQLTLVDTSVNVTAGTAYKYTVWEYREVDPFYAVTGEFEFAQNEFAHALDQITASAVANRAQVGIYEFPVHVWRRQNTIADDLPTWLADLDESLNHVTPSGYKPIEWVRHVGGEIYWNNYVPDEYLVDAPLRAKWMRRNQHIMESLADRDVPNRPLFRPLTLDGVVEFTPTGIGTKVPNDYFLEMLEAIHAFQPFKFAYWGIKSTPGSGSVAEWDVDFIELIEEFHRSIATGEYGAVRPVAYGAAFPAAVPASSVPIVYL